MKWSISTLDAPCRVNHAAVIVNKVVFSFGGYITNDDYSNSRTPIETFTLDTCKYILYIYTIQEYICS